MIQKWFVFEIVHNVEEMNHTVELIQKCNYKQEAEKYISAIGINLNKYFIQEVWVME